MRPITGYYPAIDYLRLLCALMVVAFHLAWSSSGGDGLAGMLVPAGFFTHGAWVFRYGCVGVQIFFLISGYVITRSALGETAAEFLKRRALRLYPAVLICAPISFVIAVYAGRPLATMTFRLVKSLALIPVGAWVDAPYWTLGVEIGFYGLIFCILFLRPKTDLQQVGIGLAFIGAIFWLFYSIDHVGIHHIPGVDVFEGMRPFPVYHVVHFALGMLVYYWHKGVLTRLGWAAAGAAFIAGLVETSRFTFDLSTASPVFSLLWLGGLATLILARPVSDGRAYRFARLAGMVTYPLYLVHFALGLWIIRTAYAAGLWAWPSVTLSMVLVTLIAVVIAKWLEPAVRQAMKASLSRLVDRLFAGIKRPSRVDSIDRDVGHARSSE